MSGFAPRWVGENASNASDAHNIRRRRTDHPTSAVGWILDSTGFWMSHAILPVMKISFLSVFSYQLTLLRLFDTEGLEYAMFYDKSVREFLRTAERERREISIDEGSPRPRRPRAVDYAV